MFLRSQATLLMKLMAIHLRALMMYLDQQMRSNLCDSYQNFTADPQQQCPELCKVHSCLSSQYHTETVSQGPKDSSDLCITIEKIYLCF